jgi:hypothetical protein
VIEELFWPVIEELLPVIEQQVWQVIEINHQS